MFNVERTYPEPASLAAQNSYSSDDVLDALKNIFFDKCYLCEAKNPLAINIEHLRPHLDNPSLKYKWDNLYYACARCNNLKLAKFEGILDCADPNIDVFRKIKILPPLSPTGKIIVQTNDSNQDTETTANLLSKIYNDFTTKNKAISGVYLKQAIFKKYNSLHQKMMTYLDEESTPTAKQEALEGLQTLMKRHQSFSALLRWVVLEDDVFKILLEPHMD